MAGTFVGCTPSNKPILPKNVGEPTAGSASKDTPRNPAAMIAHPEYSNWSQFPLGVKTVRNRNPIEEVRFPSQFELPQGMTEEYFQQPSLKAKKTGEEEMEVAGVKIKADGYEWTESNETGPMQVKLWRSNDIPGRIVRQEMLIEASQTKTLEEIREVDWKATDK